ncbi:MAG: phenylalanine--tRNA ligase subunit alpha [Candidatus Bipolaricaulota bacterium]
MATLESLKREIADLDGALGIALAEAGNPQQLEALRVEFLGRKGRIAQLFKVLGALPPGDRSDAGQLLNAVKSEAERRLGERQAAAEAADRGARLERERVDVTMPGAVRPLGHLHPLTRVQRDIESIFLRMGFDIATGPEIETEHYNFDALNIPADHPARADWDTFYITDTTLLRPHTSPVQIRVMESTQPPVRIICPGRCYRRDAQDATHSPVFHQIELLWVEAGLSLAHLKYVLELFTREFFGPGYAMRFSGDFFPFTEPSVQVHIRAPGAERWLEIMGAGMVDPAVLEGVGYDPEKVTGFAFGLGIERMAMLKYGIDEIRAFLSNDLRFIRQF